MFPRVKRIPDERFDETIVKFYDKEQSIEIDKCNCIGCGICSRVCPNQVIYNPATDGKIRINREDLIPSIPNPRDCSFCGICAYMCPTSAIWLKKNDVYVKRKDFAIRTKKIVPKLEYDTVELKDPETEAKVYITGNIEVDWDKCISCLSCVNVCPTECFRKEQSQDKASKEKVKPIYNGDNCIKCGSCVRACSQEAIRLNIDDIKQSGDFKAIFWNPLISRLKKI